MRRQQNLIPGNQQKGNNPFQNAQQMMNDYQKFREDYLAQNPNPDPKGAAMSMVQNGMIGAPELQQAMGMAQRFGFKL